MVATNYFPTVYLSSLLFVFVVLLPSVLSWLPLSFETCDSVSDDVVIIFSITTTLSATNISFIVTVDAFLLP